MLNSALKVFLFSILKITYHCLLSSMVSDEKFIIWIIFIVVFLVILIIVPRDVPCHFSLVIFRMLTLYFSSLLGCSFLYSTYVLLSFVNLFVFR